MTRHPPSLTITAKAVAETNPTGGVGKGRKRCRKCGEIARSAQRVCGNQACGSALIGTRRATSSSSVTRNASVAHLATSHSKAPASGLNNNGGEHDGSGAGNASDGHPTGVDVAPCTKAYAEPPGADAPTQRKDVAVGRCYHKLKRLLPEQDDFGDLSGLVADGSGGRDRKLRSNRHGGTSGLDGTRAVGTDNAVRAANTSFRCGAAIMAPAKRPKVPAPPQSAAVACFAKQESFLLPVSGDDWSYGGGSKINGGKRLRDISSEVSDATTTCESWHSDQSDGGVSDTMWENAPTSGRDAFPGGSMAGERLCNNDSAHFFGSFRRFDSGGFGGGFDGAGASDSRGASFGNGPGFGFGNGGGFAAFGGYAGCAGGGGDGFGTLLPIGRYNSYDIDSDIL